MEASNNFHAETETKNELKSRVQTQVMIAPADCNRADLTDAELKAAKDSGMINKEFYKLQFPKTTKFHVDPTIPQQMFSLVSFIPSQGAQPDSQGYYGLIKVRGCFATAADAENYAEMLLRKYDSFAEIQVGLVGRHLPLMADATNYTSETKEIDIRKTIEDTVKAEMRKKRDEENKEKEEIIERQKQLMDPEHTEEKERTFDDLEWYTTLQVKRAQNAEIIDKSNAAILRAKEVIEKTEKEIIKLDDTNPEYREQFLAKYENAIKSVGSNPSENSLISYLQQQAYNKPSPTDLPPLIEGESSTITDVASSSSSTTESSTNENDSKTQE